MSPYVVRWYRSLKMNVRNPQFTIWTISALAVAAGLSLSGCVDRQAARGAGAAKI